MSETLPENEPKQEIKIEKGIPLPPIGRKTIYPWNDMEVGDSFVTNGPINSAVASKRLVPKRFAIRKQPDGSFRIWRVK